MILSILKYNTHAEWLRPCQWLRAIPDYMKKVMLSTLTVHTHPPIEQGTANQRPKEMVHVVPYRHGVIGWMGSPKNMNPIIEL